MNYFGDLLRRREEAEGALLGRCPACRERLQIVRTAGDLRCRRCRCALLVVADREQQVVFRATRKGEVVTCQAVPGNGDPA